MSSPDDRQDSVVDLELPDALFSDPNEDPGHAFGTTTHLDRIPDVSDPSAVPFRIDREPRLTFRWVPPEWAEPPGYDATGAAIRK